jgi:4-amino-4-deoxy-L-arabinose transferase-like glycosyltransferase
MKENEYLSMAEEMKRTGDFVTRRIYFYNAFVDNPAVRIYPQPPLISYQILLSWGIFGENLWGARLLNVLFGVFSIIVVYFIALLLFREMRLALFSAFLLAIMPLAVFFSRNMQPESGAFFFMILSNLFYLKFITSSKKYNLILAGVSLSIAWLYKMSFFIAILPVLFCLPLKTYWRNKKELFRQLLALVLPYLVIVFSIAWLVHVGQWQFEQLDRVKFWEVFSAPYWQKYGYTIWMYAKGDNFTWVYLLTAFLGIILAFWRRRGLLDRYIIGWTVTLIPYAMIFSDYINQHNYYQMPFLGLVCIASAYAVYFVAEQLTRLIRQTRVIYVMIIVTVISIPFVYDAISRMHATVFLGQDVAGESLKELTSPNEKVFLLTHCQGNAVARYAQRYMGWPETLEEFKKEERKFDIKYICFYPAAFLWQTQARDPAYFQYIQSNYHLKELGVVNDQLNYFILEKGKGEDIKKALESLSGRMEPRTVYRILGRYFFLSTIRLGTDQDAQK